MSFLSYFSKQLEIKYACLKSKEKWRRISGVYIPTNPIFVRFLAGDRGSKLGRSQFFHQIVVKRSQFVSIFTEHSSSFRFHRTIRSFLAQTELFQPDILLTYRFSSNRVLIWLFPVWNRALLPSIFTEISSAHLCRPSTIVFTKLFDSFHTLTETTFFAKFGDFDDFDL